MPIRAAELSRSAIADAPVSTMKSMVRPIDPGLDLEMTAAVVAQGDGAVAARRLRRSRGGRPRHHRHGVSKPPSAGFGGMVDIPTSRR